MWPFSKKKKINSNIFFRVLPNSVTDQNDVLKILDVLNYLTDFSDNDIHHFIKKCTTEERKYLALKLIKLCSDSAQYYTKKLNILRDQVLPHLQNASEELLNELQDFVTKDSQINTDAIANLFELSEHFAQEI